MKSLVFVTFLMSTTFFNVVQAENIKGSGNVVVRGDSNKVDAKVRYPHLW